MPLYALHLVLDARRHAGRIDSDAQLRFANEDLARELEEARDEALRKRTEAEAANQSKTAFLANMSHELRTPLNAILGFSEIIARECLGPVGSPRYKEYAGDIHSSGSHLLSLINDLLDVAKIESGKMEIEPNMIETARMLEHSLKLVGVRAKERKQSLSITVLPEAEVLFADERALKQIVLNLASNAVKFTPEGGFIRVVARHDRKGDFELAGRGQRAGHPKGKARSDLQALRPDRQPLRPQGRRHRAGTVAGARACRTARRAGLDRERSGTGHARLRRLAADARAAKRRAIA